MMAAKKIAEKMPRQQQQQHQQQQQQQQQQQHQQDVEINNAISAPERSRSKHNLIKK